MNRMLLLKVFLLTVIVAFVTGCVEEEVPAEEIQSISIGSSDAVSGNVIPLNQKRQFQAQALLVDGSTADVSKQVVWSAGEGFFNVSNEAENEGMVTPIAVGSTELIATIGDKSNSLQITITHPQPTTHGDVVINEIMNNPLTVDDTDGEWFEIANTGTQTFSLIGCTVTDDATTPETFNITDNIVIGPGEFRTFANSATAATVVDFVYTGFSLAHTESDEIILLCNKTQIDWVQFDNGTTFPVAEGSSLSLNPDNTDAVSNDDGANWCLATSNYNGDLGTPGSINDACTAEPTDSGISVEISPKLISVLDGDEVQFTANVNGTVDTSVTWSLQEKVLGLLSETGLFTAPEVNTSYHVRATAVADTSKTDTATVNVSVIEVQISPEQTTMAISAQQQFTATVLNTDNSAVDWSSSGGSISNEGLFTAPAVAGTYTVTATSQADPRKSATVIIEVSEPIQLTVKTHSVSLFDGESYQLQAILSDNALSGLKWYVEGSGDGFVSTSGIYTAPPLPGTYTVYVESIDDPSVSSTVTVTVSKVEISEIIGANSTVVGDSLQLDAQILGYEDETVLWSTNGGSISENGLFTAPLQAGTYTIIASSAADPRKSASTTVTVNDLLQVAIDISPLTATIKDGETVQFSSTVINAINTSVTWEVISSTGNDGKVSATGLYTAPDVAGTFEVKVTSNEDTSKFAIATVSVEKVDLSITPTNSIVSTSGEVQLTAQANGTSTNDINWSSTGGSISTTGLFSAPSTAGSYTITATSTIDSRKTATATVEVNAPSDDISISITPQEVDIFELGSANFTATVIGTSNKAVTWSIVGFHGGITQNGEYFSSVFGTGAYQIKATSQEDPTKFAFATINVHVVEVAVTPSGVVLQAGEQYQFNANVTGHDNTSVQWSTNNGLIDATGLYTAPSAPGNYQVTATSIVNPAKSGSVTVTVESDNEDISVVMGNTHLNRLYVGNTTRFTASVTGTTNTGINWSIVEPDGGTISNTGLYTPPDKAGTYQIVATSAADPTKFAAASVRVGKVEISLQPAKTHVVVGQLVEIIPTVTGYLETDWVFYMSFNMGPGNHFRAPDIPGTYTITGCSMEVDTVCASTNVEVIADAYYEFTDGTDTFVIHLTDADKILEANDILANSTPKGVMGTILKEPVSYNSPWSYHLDPASIEFFEMAVEVCDASIQFVEDNLDDVGGATLPGNQWCPWGSSLTRQVIP